MGNNCAWSACARVRASEVYDFQHDVPNTLEGRGMKKQGANALLMAGNANLGSDSEHIQ